MIPDPTIESDDEDRRELVAKCLSTLAVMRRGRSNGTAR
jgi:hypothetical protein